MHFLKMKMKELLKSVSKRYVLMNAAKKNQNHRLSFILYTYLFLTMICMNIMFINRSLLFINPHGNRNTKFKHNLSMDLL